MLLLTNTGTISMNLLSTCKYLNGIGHPFSTWGMRTSGCARTVFRGYMQNV